MRRVRRISYTVSEALNLLFSGKAGESEKIETVIDSDDDCHTLPLESKMS